MAKKLAAIVLSGFVCLMLAMDKLSASGYFFPLFYEIPEGSVGIFTSGDRLYDGVYTPGVHPIWPSDEALIVSTLPEKAVIKKLPCLTADGIDVEFGEVAVAYRVLEDGVWAMVDHFGVGFVVPLIEKPVQQELANWCAGLTAKGVLLEKKDRLRQHLMDHLASHLHVAQSGHSPGLLVIGLEISSPAVPDEVIDSLLERSNAEPEPEPEPEDSAHEDPLSAPLSEYEAVTEEPLEKEEIITDVDLGAHASGESPEFFFQKDDNSPVAGQSDTLEASVFAETNWATNEPGVAIEDVRHPESHGVDAAHVDLSDGKLAGHGPVFTRDHRDALQQNPIFKSLWKNDSSRLYVGW